MRGRSDVLRRELRLIADPPPVDWQACRFHGCPDTARFLKVDVTRYPSGAESSRADPLCVRHGLDWAARHGISPSLPPASGKRPVAKDPVNLYVGQALRRRREHLGLRQLDVAREIKVSEQAVQKYEAGKATPSPAGLYRLAQALGCGVASLFPRVSASEPGRFGLDGRGQAAGRYITEPLEAAP